MSEPYVGPMLRHVPEYRGADGLGYGRCQECGEMWPCTVARRPAVIPPDPDRDKRVADRRRADAARAGAALDRLLAVGARECYYKGWEDGYAASEEHHNGHYDVSLPTGGEMPAVGHDRHGYGEFPDCPGCAEELGNGRPAANCCPSTTDACELGSCPRRNSPAWRSS